MYLLRMAQLILSSRPPDCILKTVIPRNFSTHGRHKAPRAVMAQVAHGCLLWLHAASLPVALPGLQVGEGFG